MAFSVIAMRRVLLRGLRSAPVQRLLNRLCLNLPGGYSLRPLVQRLRGVHIGPKVWISRMVYFDELHPEEIRIGANSSIGLRCSIFTHFYWGPRTASSRPGPVIIEEDVFIGPHCVILPHVRIGRGAVVLAGTVVSKDVPPGVLWGNPKPGVIAQATVPLTHATSYERFARGLRPPRGAAPEQQQTQAIIQP